MDVEHALGFLTEISSQIQAAVVFDEQGKPAGATFGDDAAAGELARRAGRLLDEAARVRGTETLPTQLEIATSEGSVFVVRDGKFRIVATTTARPTTGLVFYDLKSALRELDRKPSRPRRRKDPAAEAAARPAPPKAPRARKKPKEQKPDAS
jgi:predicted regulator of Ras-like GTPase activity (Roadblock/LC7/MglB family)